MDRFTLIIKRNASYEKGMYGLSIHDEPSGAGNVEPINSEAQLREKLLGFGLNEDRVKGVIDRLKDKHDWVKLDVDPPRILLWKKQIAASHIPVGIVPGVFRCPKRTTRRLNRSTISMSALAGWCRIASSASTAFQS